MAKKTGICEQLVKDIENLIVECQDMIARHKAEPEFYTVEYIIDDFYELERKPEDMFAKGEYNEYCENTN